jgi:hypothetical protein
VILINHVRPLNLPHLGQITPGGAIQDDFDRWIPYYYCVTAP